MDPSRDHTVSVTIVGLQHAGSGTENDEMIAKLLAEQEAEAEPQLAGAGPGGGGDTAASAPPLPAALAVQEAQAYWQDTRQQKQQRDGIQQEHLEYEKQHPQQQCQTQQQQQQHQQRHKQQQQQEALDAQLAELAAASAAHEEQQAAAAARYDEQLARSMHEQELRQLARQEQERLSALPAQLPDSPLFRTLSDKLLGMNAPFTRLIPQVNAAPPPPSAAAAAAEPSSVGRARLEERLHLYCLVERVVKGDGNCQFRSLSDQLFRTPRLHEFVRECVCKQLWQHPDWYAAYVPDDYHRYCASMARNGEWGDHLTLQASADYFGVRIGVLSSYRDSCFLEIEPRQARSSRMLWLSFWAELHYNSLYPEDEPPQPLPYDKLFGSRRLHVLLFGSPSPVKQSRGR